MRFLEIDWVHPIFYYLKNPTRSYPGVKKHSYLRIYAEDRRIRNIYTHLYSHSFIHIYIYMHTFIHIYTYIHTYTYTPHIQDSHRFNGSRETQEGSPTPPKAAKDWPTPVLSATEPKD